MASEVAAVAPESWKESSIHAIKVAQTVISRGDKHLFESRQQDPLPLLRDACATDSNKLAHTYVRQNRSIVANLRRYLVDTNEEIKALTRGKEALERALEQKRKDLALNEESATMRTYRPHREKEEDGADRLISAEKTHLLSLKRSLESQLRKVKKLLQMLSSSRSRLSTVLQERSRVLDLVCHNQTEAHNSLSARRALSLPKQHIRSCSAPSPGQLSSSMSPIVAVRPNPLTNECNAAISQAVEAMERSRMVRKELSSTIGHTTRLQQAAHMSVNEGIIKKIAATITLKQHLEVSAGDTKAAVHRNKHHYDTLNLSQGIVLGPESYSDLETREKLDRPLITVYQRHPGTDLPEASHLAQATNVLADSITTTRRNISLLKIAEQQLQEDVRDKKSAANVDMSIVRLRRRKANHKWVLEGSKYM